MVAPTRAVLLFCVHFYYDEQLMLVFSRSFSAIRGDRQVLVVFHQMPYFLQHFSKNWVKTLVHGTLHQKLLISRRSTSFGGF